MLPFEKIKEYTDTVCSQIRWKKAHPSISSEIEHHIIDQRDAYMKNGGDPEKFCVKVNESHPFSQELE